MGNQILGKRASITSLSNSSCNCNYCTTAVRFNECFDEFVKRFGIGRHATASYDLL